MGSVCVMVDNTVRNVQIMGCLVLTVCNQTKKQVASERCMIFLFLVVAATRKSQINLDIRWVKYLDVHLLSS